MVGCHEPHRASCHLRTARRRMCSLESSHGGPRLEAVPPYVERFRATLRFGEGSGTSVGAVAGCPLHRRAIQEERERPSALAAASHAACSALVARTPITAVRSAMPRFTSFCTVVDRCSTAL